MDFLDEAYEVDNEVRAIPKRRVTLDPEVYTRIEEKAWCQGLLPETLINLWLMKRL